MKILCYGKSDTRVKARCDFFQGADCAADFALDLDTAAVLLKSQRYDAIVIGPSVPISERSAIEELIDLFSPLTQTIVLGPDEDVTREKGDIAWSLTGNLPEALRELQKTQRRKCG